MARELSKENLELVLMQAMMAVKNVRTQHDRLLELQRCLQRHQADADSDAKLGLLPGDIWRVYYEGLDAGAKMLSICFRIAVENLTVSTVNIAFVLMPDEQLYDVLLAQRLPARPTTQAQFLARVESALLAVKMLGEHHLPRCVECLVGGRVPIRGKPLPSPDSSPDRDDDPDPVAAATEGLAKVDVSDDPVTAAKTGSKRRHAASRDDVDKALDYLRRAIRITGFAIKHIDLAVAVLSRFLDPKEVAGLAELTDKHAYLGVEISEPTTSPDPSSD